MCCGSKTASCGRFPAFTVDVVDTLGAGDTFHGAFALMLAEGADIRRGNALRRRRRRAQMQPRSAASSARRARAEVEAFLAKN